jgi:hypothetical protein
VLVGCGGDKGTNPTPVLGPKYAPSSTPSNTLHNLALAYQSRDTLEYDSLFDAAYIGQSIDTHYPDSPYVFSKTDEALHIRALFRSHTIAAIIMQIPPVLTRYTDAADTLGWATITLPSGVTYIEIDDTPDSYIVNHNDAMTFKFRPTSPSPGSPTDTTWHIVRWTETAY